MNFRPNFENMILIHCSLNIRKPLWHPSIVFQTFEGFPGLQLLAENGARYINRYMVIEFITLELKKKMNNSRSLLDFAILEVEALQFSGVFSVFRKVKNIHRAPKFPTKILVMFEVMYINVS